MNEAAALLHLYGVGFEDYKDAALPSPVFLSDWKKDARIGNCERSYLIHLADPEVEMRTKSGEPFRLKLIWIPHPPPLNEPFNGSLTIEVFHEEFGIITWNPDP